MELTHESCEVAAYLGVGEHSHANLPVARKYKAITEGLVEDGSVSDGPGREKTSSWGDGFGGEYILLTLHLQLYLLRRYLDPPGSHPKDLLRRYLEA